MSGIYILSKFIATDAIHDACERYPSPNVRQGESWSFLQFESTISIRNFGPSGYMDQLTLDLRYWEIGRFTELLSSPKDHVAASFFGRGQGRRGSGDYLFSTLACQLAVRHVNGLRPYVDEVMRRKPHPTDQIYGDSTPSLIFEIFQRLKPFLVSDCRWIRRVSRGMKPRNQIYSLFVTL